MPRYRSTFDNCGTHPRPVLHLPTKPQVVVDAEVDARTLLRSCDASHIRARVYPRRKSSGFIVVFHVYETRPAWYMTVAFRTVS